MACPPCCSPVEGISQGFLQGTKEVPMFGCSCFTEDVAQLAARSSSQKALTQGGFVSECYLVLLDLGL